MTTITISGLPSKAPLQDSYYIPVESASVTGRIQASDIATYISSKTLNTISAASGSITNALQTGSIITGAVTAASVQTTADVVIGGNLILHGYEQADGYGTFGGDVTTYRNIYSSGNIQAGANSITIGNTTVSGNATIGNLYATVRAPIQNFITTMSNVSFTGANISGNIVVAGNIVPLSNAAAVNLGSTGSWFNNVYGTAIHALYADLAEKYESDAEYEPGTVVVFGTETEVTISQTANDAKVAGVVSTNPAYTMNSSITGVAVALQGRVPCKVVGTVNRGDLMVSSHIPGVAMSNDKPEIGTVIGKAIGNHTGDEVGVIEVVVGRI